VWPLRHHRIMRLIVPSEEVALIEVAEVKRGRRSDWRDALEEPIALWDGKAAAEALELIGRLPEDDLYRCFAPGFGVRLHDEKVARAEVLFCFHCHMALMIDLPDRSRDAGATFDAESDPARELLARFQEARAAAGAWTMPRGE
jgi:hypothetical protein